jgi:hypothetical protein
MSYSGLWFYWCLTWVLPAENELISNVSLSQICVMSYETKLQEREEDETNTVLCPMVYLEIAPLNLLVSLTESQFICGMGVRKTGTKVADDTGSEM